MLFVNHIHPRLILAAAVVSCLAHDLSAMEKSKGTAAGPRKICSDAAAAVNNQPPARYLGKDYIDSTVLRAMYIMNEAASIAGIGFRERQAIEEAKRIAVRLNAESRGDPNERYARWKTNELQWLIRLEEKDLVLQKINQGRATVEKLIKAYNAEVGRQRPDFKTLLRLHSRMAELDADRANEMAFSINRRSRSISREVVASLEKALLRGDAAASGDEFRYCLRNRAALALGDEKFERLEERVSACARARDEMPVVKIEADSAKALLGCNRLGAAREQLALAEARLADIKNFIPPDAAGGLALQISRLGGLLAAHEDSLVNAGLGILKTRGVDAANDFLQRTARPAGLSREKTARLDQAILAVETPSENRSSVQHEIDAVAEEGGQDGGGNLLEEMRAKAVAQAQRRLDSLGALEIARARREKARRDSIESATRMSAEREFRSNRELAVKIAAEVYVLIENNKPRVASDLFNRKRAILRQYLASEAFAALETTTRQVVDTGMAVESDAVAYMASVDGNPEASRGGAPETAPGKEKAEAIITEVYAMLEKNDVHGASKRFERERLFLKTNLDKEAFDVLDGVVRDAQQTK